MWNPPASGEAMFQTQAGDTLLHTQDTLKYQHLSNSAVVEGVKTGIVPHEIAMDRVLERFGLQDRATDVLKHPDGSPLLDEQGQPVRAREYLGVARNHGRAYGMLLGILTLDPASPSYDLIHTGVLHMIKTHLDPNSVSG